MRNKIFVSLIIIFFSLSLKAELIFENEFPENLQGIWSIDCESGLQVHLIGKNSSLWIDEDYVGFNMSKTTNVNGWTAYKWGEIDGSYYYFLNQNSQNQLIELTPPDGWDGIDYSFLNSNEFSIYEKCDSIPSMYQIIYGEIVSLMNSKVIETCTDESKPQNCINETFKFLDVSDNDELSIAELTRAARILIYFTFIDKRVDDDRDIGFATYTTTSLFFPAISKILIGNYDYDNSNTLSLNEIYTDRIDTLDYQNLFKDNIKGLDPSELRKLIENLDFLKSFLIN
tara:strand:+ start:681 stop:1535 length:855 start_codon:yes stop_codon:yes gene_type:complete